MIRTEERQRVRDIETKRMDKMRRGRDVAGLNL